MLQFLYSLACVLIPVIIYQRKLAKTAAAEGTSPGTAHYVWVGVFLLYLWLAMFMGGFGSLWELFFNPDGFKPSLNLVPFGSFDFLTGFLNVVMFLPLGFLLPLIWKNYRSLGKIALAGLLFSLAIELSQLTNNRTVDINDLITNTLGAVFGGLIYTAYMKLFAGEAAEKDTMLAENEAKMYIILSALGEFFLYDWYLFAKK